MRFNMKYYIATLLLCASTVNADVNIVGNVSAKCVIQTTKTGVYGNPTANKLSTLAADGGVQPIIRYDVALADNYLARITHPNSFSSSPALTDSVAWVGSTVVSQTSDAGMSGYNAAKVVVDNVTQFDLTVAGSTWFTTSSTATYGVSKAFSGGTYTALVRAECIAK
jgi:hypothetical protein|tara:strand:- start:6333 stop:6833 length:501 start_codon:yes stop_codon:yes gene_type:complete